MAAGWPNLAAVRAHLRMQPDAAEDAVIDTARLAAIDYAISKTASLWPADTTDLPDALYEAALLDAGHIYRRRDSLDGTVAWGEMGAIRVGRSDPDVERLLALYAVPVFG